MARTKRSARSTTSHLQIETRLHAGHRHGHHRPVAVGIQRLQRLAARQTRGHQARIEQVAHQRLGRRDHGELAVDQHGGWGSARDARDDHRRVDDPALVDDHLAVERDGAVAHRHVVVAPRVALAAALRVRAGREQEVAGKRARRGAVALGLVAVQRDAVPQRLRVEAPAEVRDRVRVAVVGVLRPSSSQSRISFASRPPSMRVTWPSRISSRTGSAT